MLARKTKRKARLSTGLIARAETKAVPTRFNFLPGAVSRSMSIAENETSEGLPVILARSGEARQRRV